MIINTPTALNELGGRKNNEDAVYPAKGKASEEDRFYLVCDGVGGQEKGELASALICQHFPAYIKEHRHKEPEPSFLSDGLRYVESRMNDHLLLHKDCKSMASTLTLLYLLKDETAIVGWVGDSRIYQIRNGKIIFKSKDHSEVQSLLDMGEITEEEAENHPRKNVITRAVNGDSPARMDTEVLTDIRKDDFFMLCTDGILETLKERDFPSLFMENERPENIRKKIFKKANGKTRDNFSMYLIKVQEVARPVAWQGQVVQAIKGAYQRLSVALHKKT